MKNLIIVGTENTPNIHFDPITSFITISGNSLIDDRTDTFAIVHNWLDTNFEKYISNINLSLELDYLNDESSKCIMALIYKLKKNAKKGTKLIVYWKYKKNHIQNYDVGVTMSDMLGIEFLFIEI